MVKQSLSAFIAVSLAFTMPVPVFAAAAATPACVTKAGADKRIVDAWELAKNATDARGKKTREAIKQFCKAKKEKDEKFLAALENYVNGVPEGQVPCLDPDKCDKTKGPIQKSGIDQLAGKITEGPGKVTETPPPAAPASAAPEKTADGPGKLDTSPPPAAPPPPPPATPAPRFTAATDTGLSQNLMWGLGGLALGGIAGYLLGQNNNNNGYNHMMPMYPRPWMQPRPPFGMGAPPILPMMGPQPWMNSLGMGGMGGMPGMINPNAPGAIPLYTGGGVSPLGGYGGYGGYGNLGGYAGLGGIGSVPNYYMPGTGQISTGVAPPILPQFPTVPAYSTMLQRPMGGY
jgi:hypothetical protein